MIPAVTAMDAGGKRCWLTVTLLLAATAVLGVTQVSGQGPYDAPISDAPPCNATECDSAVCRCSSTASPGGLAVEDIPQFVVISFDDGVTITNYPFYDQLSSYQNPNGCGIGMTFFVSHENTDYTLVNDLHRRGHEVATHSVTHKPDLDHYWRNMTSEAWTNEMVDMKKMLELYGNINQDDILGFRVPFLEVGGNLMYETLLANGFKYDCSWPTLKYTPWYTSGVDEPLGALWPYTLDYFSVQEQTVGIKPTESFPGLWLSPMTDMQDNRGIECPMLDLCQSADGELESSAEAVKDLLERNFKSHFYGSRTPFGLYVHHSWFLVDDINNSTARHDGFTMFLTYLSSFPEVYVVSVDTLVEWVKNPYTLTDLDDFAPLQCPGNLPADTCPDEDHQACHYTAPLPIGQSEVYMTICQGPCPEYYPYVGNPYGNSSSYRTWDLKR